MTTVWDSKGATITPSARKIIGPKTQRPPQPRYLTHAEISALSDYEAFELNLPNRMDAVIAVTFEGRIDSPEFRMSLLLEPLNHMQPWANYRRIGAIISVGERVVRLTSPQYALFQAFDAVTSAGTDIASRLRSWPLLAEALKISSDAHVVIPGHIPQARIIVADCFPQAAMTRVHGKLSPAADHPDTRWAMAAGHTYYLRNSAPNPALPY